MIKLQRVGKKHQASFRVVVDEKRHKLHGKHVDDLGWYNPHQEKHQINAERVQHWLKNGAKATATVHNLLINTGILQGKKIPVHKQPKTKKEEAKPAA